MRARGRVGGLQSYFLVCHGLAIQSAQLFYCLLILQHRFDLKNKRFQHPGVRVYLGNVKKK